MTTRIPTVTALVLAAVAPTASADTPTEPARPRVAVAAADPQAPTPTELALLLAPVAETPAPSTSTPVRRTPRFALAAGPYTTTRALAFAVAETTPVDELPETPPESTLVGARIEVAIFPAGGASSARDPMPARAACRRRADRVRGSPREPARWRPPRRRVAVDHRVHVPGGDAEEQAGPPQGGEGRCRPPIGLGDDADTKALGLQQASDDRHAEARVVDVGVARHQHHVALLPPEGIHLRPGRRQKRRRP
jgi:hypothetical protein